MTTKSTSGFWLELSGRDDHAIPIDWGAQKPTCTSKTTQEAETVSAGVHLKHKALPVQHLLQTLLGRQLKVRIHEDNSSSIQAIEKGYSPSLRSLLKTHNLSFGFLRDTVTMKCKPGDGNVRMYKQDTETQKGDYFTKITPTKSFPKFLGLFRIFEYEALSRSAPHGRR